MTFSEKCCIRLQVCDEAVELSFRSSISIQSRDTYDYLLEIASREDELELL